jgi:Ca2+-binding RTX toxin-like protein
MTRRGQGLFVALAVITGIALASGGVVVLAGSGKPSGTTTTTAAAITPATVGDAGPNRLIGTNRRDVIDGRGGNDVIKGRGGTDVLRGGGGRDRISGGKKFDRIDGERGSDRINARDGQPDEIDCGLGRDVATVDRHEDGVFDCEHLRAPPPFGRRGPG